MKKLTLIIIILGIITISNAQIEKNELKLTPEIEKTMIEQIKNLSERAYSDYGITNKSQIKNLHFGKPIPRYMIVNEKLEPVYIFNVSRMFDEKHFSLRFMNTWNVPVMSEEDPLLFGEIRFSDFGRDPYIGLQETANTIEHFHNYVHKDLVIGSVAVTPSTHGMDYLIIRKEEQDIFVHIYDEETGEYFKNEYNFSELINHIKELDLRAKEEQMKYYEKIATKNELEITPEIEEMVINRVYSKFTNKDDTYLSKWNIKEKSQLDNLQLGKPIPKYRIVKENLTFIGYWEVPVLSDSDPLYLTTIKLEEDGQYSWSGSGGAKMAEAIHSYEYKDLIIGFLGVVSTNGWDYLIIRKDNKDIFVKGFDWKTREVFKTEFTLSEIINLIKE